jgi:hypothetical protein
MMRTTPRPCSFVLFLLVTSLACSVFAGKPQNVFMQKTDGKVIQGMAIWRPASQAYLIKVGKVQQTIPARDIAAVKPAVFPPALRKIMQAIDSGSSASPYIAKLEAITRDWEMMGADLKAIPYLARGYLQLNQTDKAISKCEELFRKNPMTKKDMGIQSVYWSALLKKGDKAKLNRGLAIGIRDGSRPTQAAALVMRGDLLGSDKTKTREALIDGYLRVILFYQDEKNSYQEALFKAAKAHTVLNEHHYAEKWRVKLRSQFPNGKWTRQLTS